MSRLTGWAGITVQRQKKPRRSRNAKKYSRARHRLHILQGKAIDGTNQLSLNAVYIDVYRVDENGGRELIRAQRYPNGTFQLYLQPRQKYELELFQGGFKSQTVALRFRDEDRGQTLQRTFQLFPE